MVVDARFEGRANRSDIVRKGVVLYDNLLDCLAR